MVLDADGVPPLIERRKMIPELVCILLRLHDFVPGVSHSKLQVFSIRRDLNHSYISH